MTDFSELLDEGRIQPGRFSREQVDGCLHIARRDLEAASAIIDMSPEWAFNIAYNAAHQAGRALMFHRGFRAVGEGHHATVIRFLEIGLGPVHEEVLAVIDRMRRRRNRATYDSVEAISRREADEAISTAREFVITITPLAAAPAGPRGGTARRRRPPRRP